MSLRTLIQKVASSSGTSFAPHEPTNRSDAAATKLSVIETTNRSDKAAFVHALAENTNRGDTPKLTLVTKTPDTENRTDLGNVVMKLTAISRSASPDSDSWGDAWTDSTVGQTGTNNGNSTPLQFGNVTVGTKLAYIQIDLTKFKNLTATGAAHTLVFQVVNNDVTSTAFQVAMQGQAGKPFTESTLTQSNQPATPSAITRAPTAAVGANTITVTLTNAEMQQLLGNWVLIVLGKSFAGTNAWTMPSREDATASNRMALTFTAKTQ